MDIVKVSVHILHVCMQEAELMSFNKPLKLPKHVQQRYFKSEQYGRVTTAFTVARKEQFHTVPYLRGDDVLKPEVDFN